MKRKERIAKEYRRMREGGACFQVVGSQAKHCFAIAKTSIEFEDAESAGLVRLRFVPDCELFDDSFIDTWDISDGRKERAKKELWEQIERDGVWGLVGEFRMLPLHHGSGDIVPSYGGEENEPGWEDGDAVWGFVGTEPNGCEDSIKSATLEALRAALKSRCPVCRKAE